MTSRSFYLEPLAIVFSLTYALLMWSCVVASLVPHSSDSDDDPFFQRLCILCRSITVLLPERDDEDLDPRRDCLWNCRRPRNMVRRKLLGLKYW